MTQERLQQVKDVQGWKYLDQDEASSTVSEFQGGHIRHKDVDSNIGYKEILVWEGVRKINDETGEEEVFIDDAGDVPEWANYIIESLHGGIRNEVKFAETEVGAWTKAKRLAEQHN